MTSYPTVQWQPEPEQQWHPQPEWSQPQPQPQPQQWQPEWPQPPQPPLEWQSPQQSEWQSQQRPQPEWQSQTQRTWDLVLAIVLYSGAALLGLVAAYATCFFAFAADSCGANNCNDSYLGAAFIVSWGGTAVALVGSLVMIIVAAMKRWYMWYWPILAGILIVASFAGGVALASQVYVGS